MKIHPGPLDFRQRSGTVGFVLGSRDCVEDRPWGRESRRAFGKPLQQFSERQLRGCDGGHGEVSDSRDGQR